MDILNESCTFQCSAAPSVVIAASEVSNDIVKEKSFKVLTTSAVLSVRVTAICPILTAQADGTPVPCSLISGTWRNASSKMKVKGSKVLTQASSNTCSHGGAITCRPTNSICKIN